MSSGLPELIDRIPTMMMGTSLPSVLFSPRDADPDGPCSEVIVPPLRLSELREAGPSTVPKRNILKKFSWFDRRPSPSVRLSSPCTLCLRAVWRLPFCNDSRKLSNAPLSLPRKESCLVGSSPMMEAAVCRAAAESKRDSMAVCSSPRCIDELLRLSVVCGRLWRSREPRSRNEARRAETWLSDELPGSARKLWRRRRGS